MIWGKIAENMGNTVKKGQRLLVEGRLQIRSYDTKDGSKRWMTEVIASSCEYIERKNTTTPPSIDTAANGFENFGSAVPFDEEIPF